jgi:lycopene beta-cyclase
VAYWQFDLLALVLPTALLLRGAARPPVRLWAAVAALSAVALAWTAPWDEHLVRTGVWSYGADRVLATVGSVPVEEYAFVVLLVVLVAAWGVRTGRLPAAPGAGGQPGPRAAGALAWLGLAAAGAGLVAAGGTWRYLGLLLIWVAPPLALQRAVAGDLLRARRADRLLVAAPVALWLCAADRLALADGVWLISPASSSGILVLGLPVEEALFFCLVTLLVTDGLFLATHSEALARARALLPRLARRRVASAP